MPNDTNDIDSQKLNQTIQNRAQGIMEYVRKLENIIETERLNRDQVVKVLCEEKWAKTAVKVFCFGVVTGGVVLAGLIEGWLWVTK